MCFAGTVFTQRFGLFISLLMAFGWYFGTCFLLPLFALIGPKGSVGEVTVCLTKLTSDEDAAPLSRRTGFELQKQAVVISNNV